MGFNSEIDKGRCSHPNRQFVRVPFTRRDGVKGAHVKEQCLDCGENPRGAGQWVGKAELLRRGIDPATLPTQGQARQSPLFSEAEDGK